MGRALLEQFQGATLPTAAGGTLTFRPTYVLGSVLPEQTEPIVPLRGEQSNTSLRFGDTLILKLFRRVQFGPNPDVEVGRFLTEHTRFRGTPAVAGSLEYTAPDGRSAALALLQCFEPNRGDAWQTTLERLAIVLDEDGELGPAIQPLGRLGEVTAELHLALASGGPGSGFEAEPITAADLAQWRDAIHAEIEHAARALAERQVHLDLAALLERADRIEALVGSRKVRHHGDYHLGQVLECDNEPEEFAIIDFEGEPAKPLALRREKRSPLRDVAGMLRSFDYARHAALRAGGVSDPRRSRRAAAWYQGVRRAFLDAYLATIRWDMPELLPEALGAVEHALVALEIEKAAYEVLYELHNRPDWLAIPLAALAPERGAATL